MLRSQERFRGRLDRKKILCLSELVLYCERTRVSRKKTQADAEEVVKMGGYESQAKVV